MADIFISYSREDRERAHDLANALERTGWSVWWDRIIPAGRTFDEVIEEAIDAAKCVVVVWSEISVKSRWVRTEAEEGAHRGILVPVLIDDVRIPLAFRRIQAADLTDWDGSGTSPAFQRLVADIKTVLGTFPAEKAAKRNTEMKRQQEEERRIREGAERRTEEAKRKVKREEKYEPAEQPPPEPASPIPVKNVKRSVNPVHLIGLFVLLIAGGIIVWQSLKSPKPVVVVTPQESAVSTGEKGKRIETSRSVGEVFQDELKIGGLGPKMVVLPTGSFLMGSTTETDGDEHDNDEHQHKVTIDKPFAIGQYEVTNSECRRFKPGHDSGIYRGLSLNGDNLPVVRASWNEAVSYAKWLSEQTGKSYRLPTEAEWEYAARAGTTTRRYWGDDTNKACDYANVYDQTSKRAFKNDWTHHDCDDGFAVSSPVGRFKPNAFRLYDVLGNVWEWTCSEYDEIYAGAEKRCITEGDSDPSLRGGSWDYVPRNVRSAARNWNKPSGRFDAIGFRLAQDT